MKFSFKALYSLALLLGFAQFLSVPNAYADNEHFDVSVGSAGDASKVSLSYYHLVFKYVGYGVRYASFQGNDLIYKTAPEELQNKDRINRLEVADPQTNSLNLSFNAVSPTFLNFGLGFNIDVAGIGFGANNSGTYKSGTREDLNETNQKATPTISSQLRGDAKDIGQLDSEFFLSYKINGDWTLRFGRSHFFSEYTTKRKLDDANQRFRHVSDLNFIAISYALSSPN